MDSKRVGKIGFSFREDFSRPGKEILARLGKFSTPNISDGFNKFRTMDYRIKPIFQNCHIVGPALTVRVRPADNLMAHKAIELAQPGDIIVIDAGGCTTNAVWGELMSMAAMAKGVAGLVVDGAIRDVVENRELGFPIFTKYIVPNSGDKEGPGEIGIPISCGGIPVQPGDIVVGDDNGVAVIPPELVDELIKNIEKKLAYEEKRKEDIAQGRVVSPATDNVLREKEVIE